MSTQFDEEIESHSDDIMAADEVREIEFEEYDDEDEDAEEMGEEEGEDAL